MPSSLYKDLKLWYKPNRNSTGVTYSQIPSGVTGNGTFSNGGNNLATLVGATCPVLNLAIANNDTWQISGLVSNGIITDKEFTFYIDFDVTDRTSINTVITFHNSSGTKIMTIGLQNSANRYRVRADSPIGSNTWIPAGTVDEIFGFIKMIIKYDGSNLSLFINGIKQGFNAESFTDVINSIIYNDNFDGVTQIKEIAMWNSPKTDAECLELTRT
tara:strand:+ start:325 stop:969 length:645 start_codon:yes stop_codon:yes gene_type:complete